MQHTTFLLVAAATLCAVLADHRMMRTSFGMYPGLMGSDMGLYHSMVGPSMGGSRIGSPIFLVTEGMGMMPYMWDNEVEEWNGVQNDMAQLVGNVENQLWTLKSDANRALDLTVDPHTAHQAKEYLASMLSAKKEQMTQKLDDVNELEYNRVGNAFEVSRQIFQELEDVLLQVGVPVSVASKVISNSQAPLDANFDSAFSAMATHFAALTQENEVEKWNKVQSDMTQLVGNVENQLWTLTNDANRALDLTVDPHTAHQAQEYLASMLLAKKEQMTQKLDDVNELEYNRVGNAFEVVLQIFQELEDVLLQVGVPESVVSKVVSNSQAPLNANFDSAFSAMAAHFAALTQENEVEEWNGVRNDMAQLVGNVEHQLWTLTNDANRALDLTVDPHTAHQAKEYLASMLLAKREQMTQKLDDVNELEYNRVGNAFEVARQIFQELEDVLLQVGVPVSVASKVISNSQAPLDANFDSAFSAITAQTLNIKHRAIPF